MMLIPDPPIYLLLVTKLVYAADVRKVLEFVMSLSTIILVRFGAKLYVCSVGSIDT